MFKHILLPTDGSKLSERSVREGIRMAKQLKASVTALHVIPKVHAFDYQMDMLAKEGKGYEEERAEQAEGYLRFVKKSAASADVKCDVMHVVSDQPYKAIIKAAGQRDCDLILMASHGRKGIEGLLLGSETQKVLTHSKVPVLVYR